MQQRVALLQARPTALDEYMGYLVMHTQQVEEKKTVLAQSVLVDDMYDMLSAYEQKVPMSDQVRCRSGFESTSARAMALSCWRQEAAVGAAF